MGAWLTGIVLAAGLSRRAAPFNKLLLPSGGGVVVNATVAAVCGAGLAEVIVVTGHERERIEAALEHLPVRFEFAARFAEGMGNSLAAGIRAASGKADGFVVCPGDLPRLKPSLVTQVTDAFSRERRLKHVIPTARGRRGHPVVIGAWLRADLEGMTGDEGARSLLARPCELARCCFLEVGDPGIHADVDEPGGQPG